jgi:hypothetical protein
MRTAIIGAAASALLGGTLAITPLTSVSNAPVPGGPACANGCDQAGAVLMPETAKPQAPSAAPAANVGGPSNKSAPAANLTGPGSTAAGSSGAHVAPGAASGGAPGGGGAPGLAGAPDVPGMNEVAGFGANAGSITQGAQAVQQVWGTAVGVPTSLVGLAGGAAGVLSSVSVSLFYLEYAGILPKNLGQSIGLPSGLNLSSIPGISLPQSLQSAISRFNVPTGAAAVPGAAAAIRGVSAVPGGPGPLAAIRAGAPAGTGPLAAIRAAAPGGPGPLAGIRAGLPNPGLPKTPGWRDLPHPHLPGPMAILKPHCIGPHLGPIGACIP